MRFVLAIVLFLCALAATGLGIAQRTVLAGPDEMIATGDVSSSAPVTVVSGATLNAMPGNQTLTIDGSGDVFAAYGRTTDVLAWVGDAQYNSVGYSAKTGELTTKLAGGSESSVPTAAGSDLWLSEKSGPNTLIWSSLNLPADMSVIITGDGDNAAPGDLSLRWPVDNSAPYSGPLIVGGLALLVLGLLAFVWALVHARRRRGPRRKQPRLPRAPKPPRISARSMRALPAGPERGRRRNLIAVPILGLSLVLLSGCSAIGDVFGGDPVPAPSASAEADADLPPVAVTTSQLAEILDRVTTTVTDADTALDATVAETRLAGPALAARTANYTLRKADGSIAAEPAIPTGKIALVLPQQYDGWPRSVFTVVSNPADETIAPMALMLIQDTPRSQYHVEYAVPLQPGAEVPALAPATVGAPRLKPDSTFLKLAPDQLAQSYGSILLQGAESPSYDAFDSDDPFGTTLAADKASRKAGLPASAALEFSNSPGSSPTIVFGTNDAGAIVMTSLDDVETVKPAEAGAAINPSGSAKVLSGKTQTTKGIIATYALQLLFYVPPATDKNAKIVVLGGSQSIVSATEVP